MPMDSQITPVSALGRVTTDPDIRWKSRKRSRLLDIDISETFVTTEMITEGVQPLTCESRELEFYYTCQHCSFCSYDSSEFKDHLSSRRPGCYFQCDLCTFNSCTTSGIRIHTEKLHSSLPINFEIIPKMQPTQTIMDVNNVSEIEIERSFRRHETIANADVISEESALSPRFEYDGGDESMVGNSAEEESMKTLICESIQVKPVGFSVGCASIEEDAHEKEQETTIRFGKEVQLFRLETEPEEILGSPKESLICMFCNKEFKARLHLEHHYSIHTEEDLFKCELCSYATNCISHLQMHQGSIKGLTMLVLCVYPQYSLDSPYLLPTCPQRPQPPDEPPPPQPPPELPPPELPPPPQPPPELPPPPQPLPELPPPPQPPPELPPPELPPPHPPPELPPPHPLPELPPPDPPPELSPSDPPPPLLQPPPPHPPPPW
ncbi:unnamed protein product [Allacma fusca]|uniref:C2H2-type domain-containing protein n=1 Tax=Allacma fusca TaxID=39272 RepID=A0A8J2P7R1_9HEXA|nr:unnamed protein product [Allacma fusca]